MRVLALDISLNCTGWAVVDVIDGEVILVDKGGIDPPNARTHPFKMRYIFDELTEVIRKYKPTDVCREKGFVKGSSTRAIFKATGVCELAVAKEYSTKSIPEFTPAAVKKCVTGNGKASKEQVANRIKEFFSGIEFKTDDESDAVAIALTYLVDKGVIKIG